MDVIDRINELSVIARARMDLVKHAPNIVYAEIFFMTDEEVAELHELKLRLNPGGNGSEAKRAAKRIKQKHEKLRRAYGY